MAPLEKNRKSHAVARTATAADERSQPHGTPDSHCEPTVASIRVPSGDPRAAHHRAGGHPGTTGGRRSEGGELRRRGRHRDDGGRSRDAAEREPSESSLGFEFRHEQPQRTEYVAAVLESSARNGKRQELFDICV